MTESPHLPKCISLLNDLIRIPSFSRQESETANLLDQFLQKEGITSFRKGNNVWAPNQHFAPEKPTILLNSHHDTVKPSKGWDSDPFCPLQEGDKLTGLGSNDAGGPLVSLIACFLHFYSHSHLPFNLILAVTAEEEISGAGGIASLLPDLGKIFAGIVGEPTQMNMAVAEKGLMVLDCVAKGRTGHAAREEGINAIYQAMKDLEWFRTYQFPQVSDWLGAIKMSVTQIEAGIQHNVVPDQCTFVVDVRTTDCYSNQEIFDLISKEVGSEVSARSFRLNSSGIAQDHPLVISGKKLGLSAFGSPTLSDQALMSFPTIKLGPGDSARSHTPNEHIYLSEIDAGIQTYVKLLAELSLS